jgi:hypothetical protein
MDKILKKINDYLMKMDDSLYFKFIILTSILQLLTILLFLLK